MTATLLSHLVGHLTRLWNSLVPKRAVAVEHGDGHVRYLHPTKGWRYVANRRLGILS